MTFSVFEGGTLSPDFYRGEGGFTTGPMVIGDPLLFSFCVESRNCLKICAGSILNAHEQWVTDDSSSLTYLVTHRLMTHLCHDWSDMTHRPYDSSSSSSWQTPSMCVSICTAVCLSACPSVSCRTKQLNRFTSVLHSSTLRRRSVFVICWIYATL